MEVLIKTTETVTIKMTKEEALWLKKLVQNPLIQDPSEEFMSKEDSNDKKFREKFWYALAGKLYPLT